MRVVGDLGVNIIASRIRIANQKRFRFAVLQFENDLVGGGGEGGGGQARGGEGGNIVVDGASRWQVAGRRDHARHRGLVGGESLRSSNRPHVGIVLGENRDFARAFLDFEPDNVRLAQGEDFRGRIRGRILRFFVFFFIRPPEGARQSSQQDGGDQ